MDFMEKNLIGGDSADSFFDNLWTGDGDVMLPQGDENETEPTAEATTPQPSGELAIAAAVAPPTGSFPKQSGIVFDPPDNAKSVVQEDSFGDDFTDDKRIFTIVVPSTSAATTTLQPTVVAEALPVEFFPTRNLGIVFNPTDNTKSVVQEEDGSFRVRKDANLKLKLDANGLANRVAYTLRAWVTYKNQSYSHRVEVMDPDLKKDNQLESLSVFSLGEKVTWISDGKHIVGQVNAFKMTDSLFVKFRAVSSEVKKGNGWIFNCCLTDQYGCVVATGSVDVKSLKIIRTPEQRGIKRKRRHSSGYNMTPSSSESESSEIQEEALDFSSKTSKELQVMYNVLEEEASARRKMCKKIMEEFARRNEAY